ncbi:MAG: site-specific integrase, partial [Actinomycetota bacterium]|nr:site-specific integrase [Actinomycetota bacterium]
TADGVIVKGTKSGKVRRVSLDQMGLQMVLARLKDLQASVDAGFDLVDDPYLFAGDPSGGAPWHPDWPTHAFRKSCDDLGMKWHFHQLRHFTATQLIAAGLDVRTVSGRLGHADPSVTLRVYSHVVEAKDREAAAIMGGLLAPSKAIGAAEPKKVLSKRRVAKDQGD